MTTPTTTGGGNFLRDLLPPKLRQWLYALVFLALLGYGAWQAADGNVSEAIFGFFTSLAPLLAAGNITPEDTSAQQETAPQDLD